MNGLASNFLKDLVTHQKHGNPKGLLSICSANPFVIQSAILHAKQFKATIAIESTSAQVNQYGGYTGMSPRDFAAMVEHLAAQVNFSFDNIILGGDHLGPNPWCREPAAKALENAKQLVHDYILAGYKKIHLDTSMPCIDDALVQGLLAPETAADRAADLCHIAELAYIKANRGDLKPMYVIGTDTPRPGGMEINSQTSVASTVESIKNTIHLTKDQFLKHDVEPAWHRTAAIVVQSGVEFGPEVVFAYSREKTREIVNFIQSVPQFVFEAHSTDYQRPNALNAMVKDQFAILKVGPALTFALREALFALSHIEHEWLKGKRHIQLSDLTKVVEKTMLADPSHWAAYYHGDPDHCRYLRTYGYSDRIRYYWPYPPIQSAIKILIRNLSLKRIPIALISQYLPNQLEVILENKIDATPTDVILNKIQEITFQYLTACGVNTMKKGT